jgi:hypothetical protein
VRYHGTGHHGMTLMKEPQICGDNRAACLCLACMAVGRL